MPVAAADRKRRAHPKSRHGCLECKARHRKCDEVQPRCGHCVRFKSDCSLAVREHDASRTQRSTSSTPSGSALLSERVSADPSSQPPTSDTLDLELMASASIYMMRELDMDKVWQVPFVQKLIRFSLSKQYTLHVLMATTALHLYADDPSRRECLTRASYHHSEALRLAQPHIQGTQSADEDDAIAILLFSSQTAVCALAQTSLNISDGMLEDFDAIEQMVHVFKLWYGIRTTMTPNSELLQSSWAWDLVKNSMESGSHLKTKEADIPAYWTFRSLAFGIESTEERKLCLEAVELTFQSISLVQQSDDKRLRQRLVTSWSMTVGPPFVDMVIQRKPVPLAILTCYAVLMQLCNGLWWVGKWPAVLFDRIKLLLGPEWKEILRWPEVMISGAETDPGMATE